MKRLMFLLPVAFLVAAAQPRCTAPVGTYTVSYSGYLAAPQQGAPAMYVTILGVLSIGYDQTISGGATMSVLGTPQIDYVVPGNLTLNGDCTGKLNLAPYPKGHPEQAGSEIDRFVLDPERKTITVTVIYADGYSVAALGIWKQISPVPSVAAW